MVLAQGSQDMPKSVLSELWPHLKAPIEGGAASKLTQMVVSRP